MCSVAALMPTEEDIKTWLSILGTVVISASLLTSLTPTPPPGTRRAKLYVVLEMSALLFGRAKDRGLLPARPAFDQPIAEAIAMVKGEVTTVPQR